MIKNVCLLLFIIFSIFSFGQVVVFQKNDNSEARELEHSLNKNEDSLILKSEKIIRQVDIFNDDYMHTVMVNSHVSKIDVSNLPIGEFIIQARLGRKRIIMYLVNNEPIEPTVEAPKIVVATSKVKDSDHSSILGTKKSTKETDTMSLYWVVYEQNTTSGTYKSMSMEDEEEVSRLISMNRLELSTEIAKNNTLLVYEVYNTSKFMRKQLRNSTYFKSSESNVFNVIPYYTSKSNNEVSQ
ncbi:hypothetical protein [Winogradskyella forsetii]|uniref:hypothetical protein n=1 Tax=Winogradskyella forsetii TaxID=2686077 RepID=UPI0015B9D320|nr:hypothetical protein [Winogradskyella forsetii]